jgi:hypothetical protein
MFADQMGLCACCYKPMKPGSGTCVDHCHTTGEVRELLCRDCNLILGLAGDDPSLLESQAAYLRKHEAPLAVKQREFRQSAVGYPAGFIVC